MKSDFSGDEDVVYTLHKDNTWKNSELFSDFCLIVCGGVFRSVFRQIAWRCCCENIIHRMFFPFSEWKCAERESVRREKDAQMLYDFAVASN